ncbi:MAG: ATP-binding protein [Thiolinea sp.]
MFTTRIWSSLLSQYNVESNNGIEVKRLNLMVGINNSGKSKFIRTLFFSDKKQLLIKNDSQGLTSQEINSLKGILEMYTNLLGDTAKQDRILKMLSGKINSIEEVSKNFEAISSALNNSHNKTFSISDREYISGDNLKSLREKISEISQEKKTLNPAYYIPILRGMRPLAKENSDKKEFSTKVDSYKDRTFHDYFNNSNIQTPEFRNNNHDRLIVTGLELYENFADMLLGEPHERETIRQYEEKLSKHFFENQQISIIPKRKTDTIDIKIGDEKQFPIYNLGDGLQQIIIITSAAFLEKRSSMFYIEEPENNLHPGFLRQLAKFLLDETDHQYFITTHSNHLLDLAEFRRSDVSIHKFKKNTAEDGSASFHVTPLDDERGLLTELGVHPSSVYLANCTIWVEGITDRLYLRAYMKKYIDELTDEDEKAQLRTFMENYHYAFVEYQGSNLSHWNFDDPDVDGGESQGLSALKTSANAFLIVDRDISSKRDRLEKLQQQMGDSLYATPGKEIENMLPREILINTAQSRFSKMKEKTKENLDIAQIDEKLSDYADKSLGIGYYLDKALGLKGKGKNIRQVFADNSSTVKNKVEFCRQAISEMEDNNDWQLTDELSKLCKTLFDHIKHYNQGI